MKKLLVCAMLLLASVSALAQFSPGQTLTAAALNNALATPTITGGTITGLSAPIPLGSGGTGATTATGATSALQYLQGAAGSVARSLTSKLQDLVNAKDFGMKCDNSTDDTVALTNAIAALSPQGGAVQLPITGSPCLISSTITIGNGTSSANSTINGVSLIGLASGNSAAESSPAGGPVVLKWTGSSGGTALTVAGPIWGVKLSGIVIDCNSLCGTGFNLVHPMASRFEELLVINWKGSAYIWTAYPSGTSLVTGSQHNTFIQLRSENPVASSGASGITIGASSFGASPHLDPAQSTFVGGQFAFDASSAAAAGIILQFTDNIDFQGTTTQPVGGSSGYGLKIVPPIGGTQFPQEITFTHAAIIGNVNNPGVGWTATNGIGFFGYSFGDGETLPTANTPGQYYGITSTNQIFGNPTITQPNITGVTTNSTGAAGSIGEYVTSSVSQASAVALSNGVQANVTSIPLTAGVWLVWGNVSMNPAGTTTTSAIYAGINSVSATLPTYPNGGAAVGWVSSIPAGQAATLPVGMQLVALSAGATEYLVVDSNFSTSTMGAYGSISALRVH